MIDNSEWEKVLQVLETLEDQELAAKLLSELNQKSKELGQLLMNRDQNLDHGDWKAQCDQAKEELDNLLNKIERESF